MKIAGRMSSFKNIEFWLGKSLLLVVGICFGALHACRATKRLTPSIGGWFGVVGIRGLVVLWYCE